MNCYEAIDRMGDALEGSLAADARPGFQEHIEECAACRNYLDQLRVTREALGQLPRPAANDSLRSRLISEFRRESRADE